MRESQLSGLAHWGRKVDALKFSITWRWLKGHANRPQSREYKILWKIYRAVSKFFICVAGVGAGRHWSRRAPSTFFFSPFDPPPCPFCDARLQWSVQWGEIAIQKPLFFTDNSWTSRLSSFYCTLICNDKNFILKNLDNALRDFA